MFALKSHAEVRDLTGAQIAAFMLECDDERYQSWWPGTHLAFHLLAPGESPHHVGDVVLMDEYVGDRRLRMAAEVVDVHPGRRVVWRLRLRGIRLPVWVRLDLLDHDGSVTVFHTITAGWEGLGTLLDPVWRVYFTPSFRSAMDRHVRTEFPRLSGVLQ